jgi:hypothetical protein
MTLTGISNRGLVVIAFLVAMLWSCILVERSILNKARRETIEQLRPRQFIPAKYDKGEQPLLPLRRMLSSAS